MILSTYAVQCTVLRWLLKQNYTTRHNISGAGGLCSSLLESLAWYNSCFSNCVLSSERYPYRFSFPLRNLIPCKRMSSSESSTRTSSAKQPKAEAAEEQDEVLGSMSNTAQGFAPNYGSKYGTSVADVSGYGETGETGVEVYDGGSQQQGVKGELSPVMDRHSGYGGHGGGYGGGYEDDSGSYGYGGGGGGYHGNNDVNIRFRPNTNFDLGGSLKLKGPTNIQLPSIRLPPIRGLDSLNFRIPGLRLSSPLDGLPTDIDICPDIILSLIIAAAAAAVYLFYTTITAGRRRRRRRRRRSSLHSSSSLSSSSYEDDWEKLCSTMWLGK